MNLLKKIPQWLMFDGQLGISFLDTKTKSVYAKSRVLVAEKILPLAWEILKDCHTNYYRG
jgi:hypothetical protein